MQQHSQRFVHGFFARDLALSHLVLRRAGHTLDHWIDCFEMAGIRGKSKPDFLTARSFPLAAGALVIFNVALIGRKGGMN